MAYSHYLVHCHVDDYNSIASSVPLTLLVLLYRLLVLLERRTVDHVDPLRLIDVFLTLRRVARRRPLAR